jgi:hypothetical protein
MLSKTIKIILSLLIVIPIYASWPGSGTEADPYQIWDREGLERLSDSIKNLGSWWMDNPLASMHFKLMDNITDTFRHCLGYAGSSSFGNKPFFGTFDGNGKTIVLAIVSCPPGANASLFPTLNGGTVKNLTVEGYVTHAIVGGIAHSAVGNARILNCINAGTITGNVAFAAGIAAFIGSVTIENCLNIGSVTGRGEVGGIAGIVNSNPTSILINNCINAGHLKVLDYDISGYTMFIGGILGKGENIPQITISNCLNVGIIENFGVKKSSGAILGGF